MVDKTGKIVSENREEVQYTYVAELLRDTSFGARHRFGISTRAAGT